MKCTYCGRQCDPHPHEQCMRECARRESAGLCLVCGVAPAGPCPTCGSRGVAVWRCRACVAAKSFAYAGYGGAA